MMWKRMSQPSWEKQPQPGKRHRRLTFLDTLEGRLLLSTTYYHAGDLDPNFDPGVAALPGTNQASGYYMEDIPGAGGTNYVVNMSEGFWGYPDMVKVAYQPASGSRPAGYIVAQSLGGHILVTRYLTNTSNGDSMLDTSFNNNAGQIQISLGDYGIGRTESIGGVAVQADGKIVIVGTTQAYGPNIVVDPSEITSQYGHRRDVNAFVARLTADGQIDSAANDPANPFDVEGKVDNNGATQGQPVGPADGIVIYDFANGQEAISSVVLQAGSKIVIGGAVTISPSGALNYALLVRFNTDGSIDNSFGYDGRTVVEFDNAQPGSSANEAYYWQGAHYDGDPISGSIFGGATHSFHDTVNVATGDPDDYYPAEKGDGVWTIRQYDDRITAMAVQADGSLVVGGSMMSPTAAGDTDTVFVLARFTPNGLLDTTFGTGGITTTDISQFNTTSGGCGEDAITSIALQDDGSIVAGGYSTPSDTLVNSGSNIWARRSPTHAIVARYTSTGALDMTFGQGGWTDASLFDTTSSGFYTVNVQSDGKIVATGFGETSAAGVSFYATRLLQNGTFDPQFGVAGKAFVRLDMTTKGDAVCYGDYENGINGWHLPDDVEDTTPSSHPAIVQARAVNLLQAEDVALASFIDPVTGSITLIGVSMTTALYQGLSIPGPLQYQSAATDPAHMGSSSSAGTIDIDDPDTLQANPQGAPIPAYVKFGKLEFVRLTNDTPRTHTDQTNPNSQVVSAATIDLERNGRSGEYQGQIAEYTFTVVYSDNDAIKLLSLGNSNVYVTGPNGYNAPAALVSVSSDPEGTQLLDLATALNQSPVYVRYKVTRPTTNWTKGLYTINLNLNQVTDVSGNFATGGAMGTFTVTDVNDTQTPWVVSVATPALSVNSDTYDFQVTFSDDVAINILSLSNNAIMITGPNGYLQSAALVSVDNLTNGKPRTATYRIMAPTDGWSGNLGIYRITLQPGIIADTAYPLGDENLSADNENVDPSLLGMSHYVPGGSIASFQVVLPDTTPPTATFATASQVLYPTNNAAYQFTVTYTDNAAINPLSVSAAVLNIVTPGNQTITASNPTITVIGSGSSVVATYTITLPTANGLLSSFGTYSVMLPANAVSDTASYYVAAGRVGTFEVRDNVVPTATVSASPVRQYGDTNYQFTVTFTENDAINFTSIHDGNVSVTGPNSFTAMARKVSYRTNSDGTLSVVYAITPPDGSWNPGSDGTYTISMVASSVKDRSGNFVASGTLGTFLVNIGLTPTLNISAPTTVENHPVTLTATLSGNGVTPTGTVTFMDGNTPLDAAQPLASGIATLTLLNLPAGSHTFTAVYSGDSTYAGASRTFTQVVNFAAPIAPAITPSFTSASGTIYPGNSVTVQVDVTGSTFTPTGTVTFYDGDTAISPALPLDENGHASFSLATLEAGNHIILARYSGDINYLAEDSGHLAVTITARPTLLSLVSTSASNQGTSPTLTATVTSTTGIPTGMVLFYDGSTLLGSTALDATGTAVFKTLPLVYGSHRLSAYYPAQGAYAQSSSMTLNADTSDHAASFVTRLYQDVLLRSPDPNGLAYWVDRLHAGTSSQIVASSFVDSDECRTNLIRQLYRDILGRDADSTGLSVWFAFFKSGGTMEQMSSGFYGSQEYRNQHGNTTASVIDSYYEVYLHRSAEPAGLDYWTAQVENQGVPFSSVVYQISRTVEGSQTTVTGLYRSYLKRTPDDSGLQYWSSLLRQGTTQNTLMMNLLQSPEYYNM